MRWTTYVMNVGHVNDEGVPLDAQVNMRLTRVCGLAARQRVLLTLQGFEDLTKNEKDELFKNSIQAMKIISHAWRSYKSRLVKLWRKKVSPSGRTKS
jgi:hypothetical protein